MPRTRISPKIKKAKEWKIGDPFQYEDSIYKIQEFPCTVFGVKVKGKGEQNIQTSFNRITKPKKKIKLKKGDKFLVDGVKYKFKFINKQDMVTGINKKKKMGYPSKVKIHISNIKKL